MNIPEIVAMAEQIHGWMSREELTWLAGTAQSLPVGSVWLEIGAWRGRSTMAVGLALPSMATLHVVDRFRDFEQIYLDASPDSRQPLKDFLQTADLLAKLRPDIRVRLWTIDAADIDAFVDDNSCDVAFIDGDHSYEAVKRDCKICERKLKPQGLLCGHDYSIVPNPLVVSAIDDLFGKRSRVVENTTIWTVCSNLNDCTRKELRR